MIFFNVGETAMQISAICFYIVKHLIFTLRGYFKIEERKMNALEFIIGNGAV